MAGFSIVSKGVDRSPATNAKAIIIMKIPFTLVLKQILKLIAPKAASPLNSRSIPISLFR